ncbi:hypothetical protein NP92_06915 [Anoxybacillus gonensis]|uniref:Uncharacterized protein n=1 Tax=Anoxybacillus gonensis TaxID=198467 RepID=A0AAW7TGY2_9BACL|nr:hypothetical protein [Anoxybacillus gonensis]AKS37987.1 hypothetical protein AFK25_05380 [Anoxybacillus gonensis]KGP60947.1 hypothetical protein NP92_06915 [Anoxybacillus gonensis]MDO0877344.1 hypothetical protein [Anoxybacillus gonensis]
MEQLLQRIFDELAFLRANMATKADVAALKDDIRALESRVSHIEQTMATKDDIASIEQRMATKDDVALVPAIREMVGQLMERMTVVELHVQEIPMMKQQIEQLSQQMQEGFEKLDHQETVLQALSLRSIQQANDIHYLKTNAISTK